MTRPAPTAELYLHTSLPRVLGAIAGEVVAGAVAVATDGPAQPLPWTRTLTGRRTVGTWRHGPRSGRVSVDLVPAGDDWTLASVTLEGRRAGRRPRAEDAVAVLRALRQAAEDAVGTAAAVPDVVRQLAPSERRPTAAVGYSRP